MDIVTMILMLASLGLTERERDTAQIALRLIDVIERNGIEQGAVLSDLDCDFMELPTAFLDDDNWPIEIRRRGRDSLTDARLLLDSAKEELVELHRRLEARRQELNPERAGRIMDATVAESAAIGRIATTLSKADTKIRFVKGAHAIP
jgi:hypothetical protein